MRILLRRLNGIGEGVMLEEQAGFRKSRGTVDQMFSSRQCVEKVIEWKKKVCIGFVDLKKAYDSVPRKMMWKVLGAIGVPKKLIRLLKAMYRMTSGRVRIEVFEDCGR